MITIKDALFQLCKQHHPGENISIEGKPSDVIDLSSVTLERTTTLGFTFNEAKTVLAELIAAEPIRLLREQRNRLLASTDWRDLPSYAGTKQAEWRVYRQSLRDITVGLDTEEKVNAATFPTQPS